MEKNANIDNLTKLYNRKKINEEFDKIKTFNIENGHRKNEWYNVDKSRFLIMLDIDFFKEVNDNFGHNSGDHVLKEISKSLNQNIRKTDIIGRWGGEEFIMITDFMNKKDIEKFLEKIRVKVEEINFDKIGNKTISIGYTKIDTIDTNLHDIVERADKALYISKNNGRNQINYN